MRPIDEALQTFKIRDLQTFRTILIVLEQNNLTIEDGLKYINYVTKSDEIVYSKHCPECNEKMGLHSVNTTSCDSVGGKYRCQWYCSHCGHEEYSKKSIPEMWRRMRKLNTAEITTQKEEHERLEWEINKFLQRPLKAVCPACKNQMLLWTLHQQQGKGNIHGYKLVWFCDHCGYEKYLKHSVREEAIRLRRI